MVARLVLARVEESFTIFSYLSGMYGWVLDGISSLFEPVTGPKPAELPSKSHVGGENHHPTPPGWKAGAQAQESHGRPAKRNYQRSVVGVIVRILWCSVHRLITNIANCLQTFKTVNSFSIEEKKTEKKCGYWSTSKPTSGHKSVVWRATK